MAARSSSGDSRDLAMRGSGLGGEADLPHDRTPAVVALLQELGEILGRGRGRLQAHHRQTIDDILLLARNAVLARCTMAAWVPPGAKKPNHSEKTMSLKPCSAKVRTLGTKRLRSAPETPRKRTLPAWACWRNSPTGADTAWIWPATRS